MNVKLTDTVETKFAAIGMTRQDVRRGILAGAIRGLVETAPSRTTWVDDSEIPKVGFPSVAPNPISQQPDKPNGSVINPEEQAILKQTKWELLRSKIYIRENGVCWICNNFVLLRDFDLGHLIDRCNGGASDDENLHVMHKHCNISKPRHNTLEEAIRWRLTTKLNNIPKNTTPPLKEQISFITPTP